MDGGTRLTNLRRKPSVPPDLAVAPAADPRAGKVFESLSKTNQYADLDIVTAYPVKPDRRTSPRPWQLNGRVGDVHRTRGGDHDVHESWSPVRGQSAVREPGLTYPTTKVIRFGDGIEQGDKVNWNVAGRDDGYDG